MRLIDKIEAAPIEQQGEIALDGLLWILAMLEAKACKARLKGWLLLLQRPVSAVNQTPALTTYTEIPTLQTNEPLM